MLSFIRHFWHVLEPATPFVDGWAIEAVCAHLEAVTFGEITRLLINVPPGFCKPVQVDEPVFTDRGFVRLGDIRVGDRVLTHKGRFRPVLAVHEQGEIPVVRLSTFAGREVVAAPDHPFLTTRGWVAVGDLTDQDYVGVPRHNEAISLSLVSAQEARLLGYLVGDGSVTHDSLAFTNADQDILDDFVDCAAACGFFAYVCVHPNPGVKAKKVVLKSTQAKWKGGGELPVITWLRRHGLHRGSSYTKRIPPEVMASSPEIVANFVGAYWSCDGMISVRHIGRKTTMMAAATTVNVDLAADVQRALSILNIQSRIRRREAKLESKKQPGGIYVSYNIATSQRHEVAKFATMPGLCIRKKTLAKKAFFDCFEPEMYADQVISVESAGVAHCRCLTVAEDSSFTVNGIAVHNSLITDVFWPAWEWGPMGMAHLRYVAFSYSSRLTERDNGRFSDLIISNEYQALYGEGVQTRKTGDKKVSNTAKGWKLASSVGGVGTGERGDRVILDDPHNVKEGESEIIRNGTVQWFREAMSNRLNSPETGSIVIIMQRVHEDDVSGTVLSLDLPYCHLMIPMEYDPDRQVGESGEPIATDIGWTDPRYNPDDIDGCAGVLAWPERFSERVYKAMKHAIGPFAVAAQYQQTPEARGGGLFQRSWWQVWDPPDGKFPPLEYVVASLDSAFTEKQENDPSGFTIWGVFRDELNHRRIILLHAWRKRLRMHGPKVERLPRESDLTYRRRAMPSWGLVEWTADSCKRFKVDRLLIEAKASGITAAQELSRLHGREGWAIQLEPTKGDKVARAMAVQPTFSQEMIYAPIRDWSEMVIDEMAVFPKGKLDDLTDSATQAIRHLRDSGLAQSDEEELFESNEQARLQKPKTPLYPV